MLPRLGLALPFALLLGCPGPWPDIVSCADLDLCSTGEPSTSLDMSPSASGVQTVTGDVPTTTAADPDTTGAPPDLPPELPQILDPELLPDYLDHPGEIAVTVLATHAEGVRMQIDDGEPVELTQAGPDKFTGEIAVYTGFDNGEHTAAFTPWSGMLVGPTVAEEYVVALPKPGAEVDWDQGFDGLVAALAVLPDGRPVELGTHSIQKGTPRCYLRLRDTRGESVEYDDLLAPAHCRAIDLHIDRDTGVLRVLVERKTDDGLIWWAGEIPGWGAPPTQLTQGQPGDVAHALAAHDDLVAVCGARPAAEDALVVFLRPGEDPDTRPLEYTNLQNDETLVSIAHDCAFADDTLVLTGTTTGIHEQNTERERLFILELDPASDDTKPSWIVAGPGPGVQSRALALAIGGDGRYYLAGTTCADICVPEGEVRIYSPGGVLDDQIPLGPLGSDQFGPHDIAWSPAGHVVVARGALQDQTSLFMVQAFKLHDAGALWTYIAAGKPGVQLALAVAVGPFGEVYAGGLGPAFAIVGG
jgi:hypothetical protein